MPLKCIGSCFCTPTTCLEEGESEYELFVQLISALTSFLESHREPKHHSDRAESLKDFLRKKTGQGRKILWGEVVEAFGKVGLSGNIWGFRPSQHAFLTQEDTRKSPSYLSIEVVTPQMLTEIRPGMYKRGAFTETAADIEEAAKCITTKWARVKQWKQELPDMQKEFDKAGQHLLHVDLDVQQGQTITLSHNHYKDKFHGVLWASGHKRIFRQAGTPCQVEVRVHEQVLPYRNQNGSNLNCTRPSEQSM